MPGTGIGPRLRPISRPEVVLSAPDLEAELREHEALIREELNVHELHLVPKADEYVTHQVKPNFRALGPRVGKRMPALKRALADADGAALLAELDAEGRVRLEVEGDTITSEERLLDGDYGRIRDVVQGPDGFLYLLTDARNGKLLRISPDG